jgi:hypothetical protein
MALYKEKWVCRGGVNYRYRRIAEAVLERRLHTEELVHHIDGNPNNNELTNLLVMSRQLHVRLHKYLDDQRVIIAKAVNENLENCWKTLIVPMTTAWLETTNAKVKKLWEIGQSAAEPSKGFLVKQKSPLEGSETMHQTPETGKAVGEDIVQHAT